MAENGETKGVAEESWSEEIAKSKGLPLRLETSLAASARLPKVKAWVGQAAWQAVLTSPTGWLLRSATMRASAIRWLQ